MQRGKTLVVAVLAVLLCVVVAVPVLLGGFGLCDGASSAVDAFFRFFCHRGFEKTSTIETPFESSIDLDAVSDSARTPYAEVNDNTPAFSEQDLACEANVSYSPRSS